MAHKTILDVLVINERENSDSLIETREGVVQIRRILVNLDSPLMYYGNPANQMKTQLAQLKKKSDYHAANLLMRNILTPKETKIKYRIIYY